MQQLIARLREIGAGIIKAYETDLDHDERILKANVGREFVWVPYRNGTHITMLTPHWRDFGLALHHMYTRIPGEYEGVVPYLGNTVTGELKAITFERMLQLLQALPEPAYELRYGPATLAGGTYRDSRQAAAALALAPAGTTMVEVNGNLVVGTA